MTNTNYKEKQMEYYIKDKFDDLYLAYTPTNRLYATRDTQRTKLFKTLQSAQNIIEQSIPNLLKCHEWEVIAVNDSEPYDGISQMQNPFSEPINWEDKLGEYAEFSKNLKLYKNYLSKQLSICDLKIDAIKHKIEFTKANAVEGYKLYKMEHDILLERRNVKDNIRRIDIFLGNQLSSMSTTNFKNELHKVDSQTYTPKVLKELFE